MKLEETKLFKNHSERKTFEIKKNNRNTLEKKQAEYQESLDYYLDLDVRIENTTDDNYKAKLKHKQRNTAYRNRCLETDINKLIIAVK